MEPEQPLLRKITDEKWRSLKRQVEAARNTAVLLVHPYYLEPSNRSGAYFETLRSILEKSKFPIIILEEDSKILKLKRKLGESIAEKALIIPTAPDHPAPLLNRNTPNTWAIWNLKELSAILSTKAGIKNILIGGIEANRDIFEENSRRVKDYENLWLTKHGVRIIDEARFEEYPTAKGCAGFTYHRLIESGLFEKIRWIPNVRLNKFGEFTRTSPYAKPKTFTLRKDHAQPPVRK
ncbi:MAG: hypothetical protein NUV57_04590 [archaeon]|nr:hypothetical protein [archaeon]